MSNEKGGSESNPQPPPPPPVVPAVVPQPLVRPEPTSMPGPGKDSKHSIDPPKVRW